MDFDFYIMQVQDDPTKPVVVGILQNYESVIWSNYVDEIGTVEIQAPLTDYNLELLVAGNMIRQPATRTLHVGETWDNQNAIEVREIAIIDEIETDESESIITAKATMIDCLLEKRVNDSYEVLSGSKPFCSWFKTWLQKFTGERQIGMVYTPDLLETYGTMTISNCSIAWNTISEVIETVREQNENFNVRAFWNNGNVLIPFRSWDRSNLGSDSVIFRHDVDDISNIVINENNQDWFTHAFVAGEGEGAERVTTWFPTTSTRTNNERREMFVDARDLKSEDYSSTSEYIVALQNRGQEKLVSAVKTVEFDITRTAYEYGSDYVVGDMVGIVLESIQGMLKLPVSGAIESFTNEGYSLTHEFGQPSESFSRKMKRKFL